MVKLWILNNKFFFYPDINRLRCEFYILFENMALTLSEDVIRNRVNLQHDNLGKKIQLIM